MDIKLSCEELIQRFAEIQNISIEEAREKVGADTPEAIMKRISDFTIDTIGTKSPYMNRAQRRALKKKVGAEKYAEIMAESGNRIDAINETAKKLNYIDLIQKLRKLNEEKEKNGETITENN